MPLLACLISLGALSGALIPPNSGILVAVVLFALGSITAGVLSLRRSRRLPVIIASACAIFGIGFILASLAIHKSTGFDVPMNEKRYIACEGVLKGTPQVKKWGARADIKLSSCEGKDVDGKVRLWLTRKDADLTPGERIRFKARFYSPREYKNPGGFSYGLYLAVHGIGSLGRVKGEVERLGVGSFMTSKIEHLRHHIAIEAMANVAPPASGVVIALANGDQDAIEPSLRDTFAKTGLAHILAISGMNVGYIAAFIYFISRIVFGRFSQLLLRIPLRRLAAITTLPAIWVYVLITGSAISSIRAAIMLTVFLIAVIIARRQDLLTTLAVSVVVILLALPLSVLDVSFQLSVVAVSGIIIITPRLMGLMGGGGDRTTIRGRCLYWFSALVAVSLAATISTTPLVAYHFKFATGISILANLLAVPITGALLSPVVASASGLALIAPLVAVPLWKTAGFVGMAFISFAETTARIGSPFVFRWAPTIFDTVIVYASIALVVFWKRLPYRKALASALAAAFILPFGYSGIVSMFKPTLEITILDVGQGDSALVRFPNKEVILIDGGGIEGSDFDIGRNVVAPALWRMGIHRIDWAILTHPHHDHYRGLGSIAEEFHPKTILTNGLEAPQTESVNWREFVRQLGDSGVSLVRADEVSPTRRIGDVTFEIVSPVFHNGEELNDSSLVIVMRYGGHRFLFVGDLSKGGEERLLQMEYDLSATFLKVGHHGSQDASSSEFLKAVHPSIAAISVGEHNKYGMPSHAVLERFNAIGTQVYRTDRDGAITITSDGRDIKVDTFVRP